MAFSSTLASVLHFSLCVVGIYVFFLTWGVLQERISTVEYVEPQILDELDPRSGNRLYLLYENVSNALHRIVIFVVKDVFSINVTYKPNTARSKFSSFVFLNACQSAVASLVSFTVLFHTKTPSNRKGSLFSMQSDLFLKFIRISACYAMASPFGYASLKYIHYVAMNLGKACKLLPLVLIKVFVKREPIEKFKIFNLVLITIGVVGFLVCETPRAKKHVVEEILSADNNQHVFFSFPAFGSMLLSLLGVVLLLANLFLDGIMNAWQDEIFSTYKISPFQMMFHLNWMCFVIMAFYLSIGCFFGVRELEQAFVFLIRYPTFLVDVFLFSLCGSLGQTIVFLTLVKYGALSLVTVTVTRKLFTILLSVVYFGHQLTRGQWVFMSVVFAALLLEAYQATSSHRKKLTEVFPATDKLKSN